MLFLTSIVDLPVEGKSGDRLGRLYDLIVRLGTSPTRRSPASWCADRRAASSCRPASWQSLNGTARLASSTVDLQPFSRRDGEVLLRQERPRSSADRHHRPADRAGQRRAAHPGGRRLPGGWSRHQPAGPAAPAGARALAGRVVGRQIVDWAEVQYLASAAPVQLKVPTTAWPTSTRSTWRASSTPSPTARAPRSSPRSTRRPRPRPWRR